MTGSATPPAPHGAGPVLPPTSAGPMPGNTGPMPGNTRPMPGNAGVMPGNAAPRGATPVMVAPGAGIGTTQSIPVAADHAPGVPRRDAVLGLMGQPAQPQSQPLLAKRTGSPRMRALGLAAVWAVLLCLGGLVCGTWGLIAILSGVTPSWYEPTIVVVGVFGLALAAAAFPLAERRLVPWALLGGSTVTLVVGYVLTASAS